MKQKLKRFMAGFMAMLTLVGTLFTNGTTAFAASPQANIAFWNASVKNSGEVSELKPGYNHGKILYSILDGNSAYCMNFGLRADGGQLMNSYDDGERKSEQMNEELKETVIKVTDYTETNNARLLKRVRIIGITGVITILIAMVMDAGGLAVSPFWESVKRDLYAWTLGTLIANILYTTGWLKRISEKKDVSRKMRISGVVCAVIVIISLVLQAVL